MKRLKKARERMTMACAKAHGRALAHETRGGQGATEYAIIIAVIAVIVVVAMIAFKPQLEQLWETAVNSMKAGNDHSVLPG